MWVNLLHPQVILIECLVVKVCWILSELSKFDVAEASGIVCGSLMAMLVSFSTNGLTLGCLMIGTGPCRPSPCAETAVSVLGAFS